MNIENAIVQQQFLAQSREISGHENAISYLSVQKCSESFWRWDEDARGIVWVDGGQVASRKEIVEILRRLESKGLPQFGAVVQVLAACRSKQVAIEWHNPTEDEIRNMRIPHIQSSSGVRHFCEDRVRKYAEPEAISTVLARLRAIPVELGDVLVGDEDIAELVQILLAGAGRGPEIKGKDVADTLENGELTDLELNGSPTGGKYSSLISDLALLSKVLAAVTNEDLRAKLKEARLRRACGSGNLTSQSQSLASGKSIVPIRQFPLPAFIDWRAAQSGDWGLCSAGWSQNQPQEELVMARVSWTGITQIVRWARSGTSRNLVMALPEIERTMLHVPGSPALQDQAMPLVPGVFYMPLIAGGAGWLPADTKAMATGGWGFFSIRSNPARVSWHNANGLCHFECEATELESGFIDDSFQAPYAAYSTELIVGLKNRILFYNHLNKDISRELTVDEEILQLTVPKAQMLPMCVCHRSHVSLLFTYPQSKIVSLEPGIESPCAVYTTNGTLIIIGNGCGTAYRVGRTDTRWRLPFAWPHPKPLFLLSAGPQEFATITKDGSVTVFTLRGC